jgi:hypothetical protein
MNKLMVNLMNKLMVNLKIHFISKHNGKHVDKPIDEIIG